MPTPTLAPGARVEIRDEEWVVRTVQPARPGGHAVRVVGTSDLVRGKEAIFLTDLDDVIELAPETTALVTDDSPQYRRTRLYLEALLRRTPPPAGDARIYLGHTAAIDSAPYQLVPAAKALRQPRPRLLIADGVGLGKTIEAGILLTELIERGRGNRILVVALKSILPQFQKELWARFTIPLVRLDSVGIQRVQARIPSSMNPFHYFDRVIISIDTLKKDAKYRRYLEQCHWDVIVVDECQNVAVRGRTTSSSAADMSQRARLAQLLARQCDALILTSATPHDGSAESFASVIDLLEPTAIADKTSYTADDVRDLFVRRFKKDIAHEVGDAFHDRVLDKQHVPATPAEDDVFGRLNSIEFRTVAAQRNSRGILFRTLLLKSFLSSPAACASTIRERLKTLETSKADSAAIAHDQSVLTELVALVDAVTAADFAKYQRLRQLLADLKLGHKTSTERVVVFSERIDTLRFLQSQLTADLGLKPNQVEVFYGSLDDQDQDRILQAFGTESSPLRLFLASDAAAEGLNLHYFCHRLVHFDLPWSLITLEQRNGRIDRYGQKHEPILTYLLTRPTDPDLQGDLRVLDVLVDKEQEAHKNIGDVAWLLKLHDADRETERIARAIEEGEDPEVVLPDRVDPDDLLSILMGNDADRDPAAETTRDPSLYPDDVSYCRDALAALTDDRADREPLHVEHHDHVQGFTLHAPTDLQHRLAHLPPELVQDTAGDTPVLKLTANRERVMDALDKSREEQDRWPEWQLLWEQHPVCEWLDDALVAAFDRHEAPVLSVARGLAADETVVLMQGQLTNERGQPVIVDWFGVSFPGKAPTAIRPLATLIADTGLERPQANPNRPLDPDRVASLRALLTPAVQRAQEHMRQIRTARMVDLSTSLKANLAQVGAWHDKRIAQLAAERANATRDGRALPAPLRKRLDAAEQDVRATQEGRVEWLQRGMRTNPNPYLRVAAVIVSQTAVGPLLR